MRRIAFVAVVMVLTLAVGGSIAAAAKPGGGSCTGGTPSSPQVVPAGTYDGFTVSGNCVFGDGELTINGHLTIADGAVLNDHASGLATVHVTGNVKVGKGAVLGLGDYVSPLHDSAVVDGNIIAHQPETLYLGGMTVRGNVVSIGGGDPASERNFPIKDDTIGGNLIIHGWDGFWFGIIRVNVGGNVIVSHTSGTQTGLPGTEFEGVLDSTEVVSNTIGRNLICFGNTPPAQIGDAALDGQPNDGFNTVGGKAIGECANLTR